MSGPAAVPAWNDAPIWDGLPVNYSNEPDPFEGDRSVMYEDDVIACPDCDWGALERITGFPPHYRCDECGARFPL